MRFPGRPLPARALAARGLAARALLALLLAGAAAGCGVGQRVGSTVERLGGAVERLKEEEDLSYLVAARPAPPDPALMRALAGRWGMQAKARDALVPNLAFALRPDGGLEFLRDDAGGTAFPLRFLGRWSAAPAGPGRVEIRLEFLEARPARRCLALPGTCDPYDLPIRERWVFAVIDADTMETPGAVWRRRAEAPSPAS